MALTGKQVGKTFTYIHDEGLGFGAHHAGGELTAEMRELDLPAGTEVTLLAFDADSHDPLIEWVDGNGYTRITTVNPNFFNAYFSAVKS